MKNRLRFREYVHIQVGSKLPTPHRPLSTIYKWAVNCPPLTIHYSLSSVRSALSAISYTR
jgi:hypothetical protein